MSNYKRVFENNRYVFITIVTNKRECLLIKNIELLRESFAKSQKFYKYELFAVVVLPEHIHMIIKPEKIEDYPKIVSRIKHHFSRNTDCQNANISASKILKREKGIWQRRYWEHTIKDEDDLYKHVDYIHYNPVKHNIVNAVSEWKYSSFQKFVKQGLYAKNWGGFNDVQSIIDFEFE